MQMTSYVVGLASMTFVWSLCGVYEFGYLKKYDYQFNKLFMLILALGRMFLYRFIYVTRNCMTLNFPLIKNIKNY